MAPINDAQLESIRTRIRDLTSPLISVTDVEVDESDDADGPVVVVTVKLASGSTGTEWDPEEFLNVRRQARTVALEELTGQELRLVYEAESPVDVDDEPSDEAGDKRSEEREI